MPVEFHDYSVKVKAALNETTIAWLEETAGDVVSHAKRNCNLEGWTKDEARDLRGGYAYTVDDTKGEAKIGHPKEMVYWEEFGKKFLC